jgi:hypothetical protein
MRKVDAGLFSSLDGVVEAPSDRAAGSPSLVRSLIDQGLLDELTLMIRTDRDLPADPIADQDRVPEQLRAQRAGAM